MSGNSFGTLFKVTTFGESHGPALGVVIDGCPPGIPFDHDRLVFELARRKPGQSRISTQRKEDDAPEVLSGVFEGHTTGTPIAIIVRNQSHISGDYSQIKDKYRPGHADLTFDAKYGFRDYRGGGRSSGRETVMRVAAGAVAGMFLDRIGIDVWAFTHAVGPYTATTVDRKLIEINPVRAADAAFAEKAFNWADKVRKEGDSAGAIVEIRAEGVPPGLGEPVFEKVDALLASALMGIGAVKGVEIGNGFAAAALCGSQNNDEFIPGSDGHTTKTTNRSGGMLGGITDGDTLIMRCALKPVASIRKEQNTVSRSGDATTISVEGRHDPLIAPRFVPVAEAMVRLVLVDLWLRQQAVKAGSGTAPQI